MSSKDAWTTPSDWGKRIAETQDRILAEHSVVDEVAGRLARAEARRVRTWMPQGLLPRLSVGAAGVLIAAAVAFVLWRPAPPVPLRVQIAQLGAQGETLGPRVADQSTSGAQFVNADVAPAKLSFSDGTRMVLARGSTGRIDALKHTGARVVLEHGRLDVAVEHKDRAKWTIDVGPFDVEVVGTRFALDWAPTRERFVLTVFEGEVKLRGPLVGERAVKGGQRVVVRPRAGRMDISALPSGPPPPVGLVSPLPLVQASPRAPSTAVRAPQAPAQPAGGASVPAPRVSHAAPATRVKPAPRVALRAAPQQHALADRIGEAAHAQDWTRAVRLLERAINTGAAMPTRLDVAALNQLGDAGRRSGALAVAHWAYTKAGAMTQDITLADRALFNLARLELDQRARPAKAAAILARLIRRSPAGAFAAAAHGRLLEAQLQLGRDARATAKAYLRAAPHGPYAPLARRVQTSP